MRMDKKFSEIDIVNVAIGIASFVLVQFTESGSMENKLLLIAAAYSFGYFSRWLDGVGQLPKS